MNSYLEAHWRDVHASLIIYLRDVRRASNSQQVELYTFSLRRRLPAIRIPMRQRDSYVVLDLRRLVNLCFKNVGYATLDFPRDPEPPLAAGNAQWLDDCLRRAGLR